MFGALTLSGSGPGPAKLEYQDVQSPSCWFSPSLVGIVVLAFVLIGRERSWELLAGSPDRGQHDFDTGARSAHAQ